MQKKKVLGLFTCYNRREKTIRCVESLLEDSGIDWSFIVTDDRSTDGTSEALQKYSQITLIKGNGSCFYSGGMRLAIDAAKKKYIKEKYDFVMLLNDDVEFDKKVVSRLINALDEKNAIMVGATKNTEGKLSYGGVIKLSKFGPKFKIVMSENGIYECDTFNANCVLIPSEIFFDLDNIDPIYLHSLGDFDYGLAAKRKGIKIYVADFFVGTCNDNSQQGSWLDKSLSIQQRFKRKESVKGQPWRIWFYFTKKNFNVLSACLYTANDFIKILFKK